MRKLILAVMMAVAVLCTGCSKKPSAASDLYNGCIFTVKNGDITSYGVYIEVKTRVSDFSVLNLRSYDEAFASEFEKYQADQTRIYYRSATVYNACHKDGYGEKSYFMSATMPYYKIPEDSYRKLISKLSAATLEVMLSDNETDQSYTFNTILPVVETVEDYGH